MRCPRAPSSPVSKCLVKRLLEELSLCHRNLLERPHSPLLAAPATCETPHLGHELHCPQRSNLARVLSPQDPVLRFSSATSPHPRTRRGRHKPRPTPLAKKRPGAGLHAPAHWGPCLSGFGEPSTSTPAPPIPGPSRAAIWRPQCPFSSARVYRAGSASYRHPRPRTGLPRHTHTHRGGEAGPGEERATVALTYPEDEVEAEEQVFDAFSASFDRHDAR